MPGLRPGECGRRIAGRDACPTQEGGLPPQQGVSAVPFVGRNSALLRSRLRRKLRPLHSFLLSPSNPLRWASMGAPVGAPHKRPTKGAHRVWAALRVHFRPAPQERTQGLTRPNAAVTWREGQQGRCFRPRRNRHYRHGEAPQAAFRCFCAPPL